MPMPSGGQWPPPEWEPAYQAYREWQAWFAGDPDLLAEVYRNRVDRSLLPRSRPSQYAGGIYGRLSRWFWGHPPRVDEKDPRLHVPVAADLAAVGAELLFSEPPTLTAEDKAQQARVDLLMEDLPGLLLDAAEVACAMSGVYLRPVVDKELVPDRAFLTVVHADGALPRFRHGRMVEVTFWQALAVDGQTHWRFLEHHEPGRIEYALFRGDETTLGQRVPLTEHPDAKTFADIVDADSGQDTGLKDRLDVVYVPNRGPQRRWRTIAHLRHLGRSDFDGVEQLFDALDETWTSWMNDLQIGKGKVIVPAAYLKNLGPGSGAFYDLEQRVYVGMEMLPKPSGDNPMVTLQQFEVRVAEHQATADAILAEILRTVGYSQQTFGDKGDVAAVTATEVQARERRSFVTRDRKLLAWRQAVPDAVELLTAVEKHHNLPVAVEPFRPVIEFGDSVSESPKALAETAQLMRAAQAASTETIVRMVHPHWGDEEVAAEVAKIGKEQQAVEAPEDMRFGDRDAEREPARAG